MFNEEINSNNPEISFLQVNKNVWKTTKVITVSKLQMTLKQALNRLEDLNVEKKNSIDSFDMANIVDFRRKCKNSKLQNMYFRLLQKDFFPYARMKKYKMS
jgi:isoleucyl-tRNA synthetase